MSKKIHTVQFSNKDDFDQQVNIFLEFGCELIDGSYQIIQSDDGEVYSQVIKYENCEIDFYDNGKLCWFKCYEKKNDNSIHTGWDYTGKRVSSGKIINGKKTGVFISFCLNEEYWLDEYEDDKHLSKKYYKNYYENFEGPYEKISEKNWSSNGLEDGYQYDSYENGQIKEEYNYVDGLKHGDHNLWYENGQKKGRMRFYDDKKEGRCEWWYENGQLKYSHYHNNGEIRGRDIRYYENGKRMLEGKYDMGIKVGQWVYWYKDGGIEKEEFYDDNGKLIKTKD